MNPVKKQPAKQIQEENMINSMRNYFLKFTDYIVHKYQDKINSVVRWYVKGLPRHIASSEADDIASEARLAFIDSLKTWDPRIGELWTYASIRVKGAMQDYLRKRGADPVAGMYEWITQTAYVYMAFNQKMIHHEKIDEKLQLESMMNTLSDTEKKVTHAYYKEDKTFKEIGKELNLSESQVSRIGKAATIKMRKNFKD